MSHSSQPITRASIPPQQIDAEQAVANSSIIKTASLAGGSICWAADPGTVLIYARFGEDDTLGQAYEDKDGAVALSMSPGTKKVPLPPEVYNYYEIAFEAENDVDGPLIFLKG